MTDRDERKQIWKRWLWIPAALLAIYVLSIGPAYRLQVHFFHQPLDRIAVYPVPGPLLASYVNLWMPSRDKAIYAPRFGILVIEGNSLE